VDHGVAVDHADGIDGDGLVPARERLGRRQRGKDQRAAGTLARGEEGGFGSGAPQGVRKLGHKSLLVLKEAGTKPVG
jgi:hypothetical protein